MPYIKGENRYQITLFPESMDDYISEENPVRVIEEYVKSLDMVALGFKHAAHTGSGRPPYDPCDMLKLYLYGYLNRVRSSRRLEAEASRNLEVIWLLRKLKPDFKTISEFRKENKKALRGVFRHFSHLCKEWALYGQEVVAIDGTKFRASNSKRNNFNEKKLKRHIKYIDEKVDEYMNSLEETDQAEAGTHKPTAQEIQQRIKELQERKIGYEDMLTTIQTGEVTEISTTDPDARLMSANNNGIDISYNAQTVVDSKYSLIVDYDVVTNPTDHGQLHNMSRKALETFDIEVSEEDETAEIKLKVLADKGYYSADELKKCEKDHIETYVARQRCANATEDEGFYANKFKYNAEEDHYICPAGQTLNAGRYRKNNGEIIGRDYYNHKSCKKCTMKDKCTKAKRGRTIFRSNDQALYDRVDQRTRDNKDLYRQRQTIVEHPFGTIKRGWGYSYFLTRGLESVKAETGLIFLTYNLRRVINILGVKEMVRRLQQMPADLGNYLFCNCRSAFASAKLFI